jgi:hypothetical protein
MLVRASALAASEAPKITDWISAISAAALGFIGLIFAFWQWQASGFRPKFSARREKGGRAIELKVVNKGRAAGTVGEVYVYHNKGEDQVAEEDIHFNGFDNGEFTPVHLPGFAQMRLIIETPKDRRFSERTKLKVGTGRRRYKNVKLKVEKDVALFGLSSLLPPDTTPTVETSKLENAIREATLSVDFEAVLIIEDDQDPETQEPVRLTRGLGIECTGATVFIHNVTVEFAFILREHNNLEMEMSPQRLDPLDPDVELPLLRHRGEWSTYSWVGPTPQQGDRTRSSRVAVDFSATRDGPQKTITRDVRML